MELEDGARMQVDQELKPRDEPRLGNAPPTTSVQPQPVSPAAGALGSVYPVQGTGPTIDMHI